MKRKLLILLLGIFLLTGCSESVNEIKGVDNPIMVDKASKVITEELTKEDSIVSSYYLEYVFEDNICTKAIYHTKYQTTANTNYNLNYIQDDPEYEDSYIDDNGYLVYSFLGDSLIGQSVSDVLYFLQYDKLINVEVIND